LYEIDYVKPLIIGSWCYVGSDVRFAPGAQIGHHTFVGMGAVVAGNHNEQNYVLLAGNPAMVRKKLPQDAPYFMQGFLRHIHHPQCRDDIKHTKGI
jgi:acetyltransferase-like isoleucine patch superfamily enzyme